MHSRVALAAFVANAACVACATDEPPSLGWLSQGTVQYEDQTPIVGATVDVYFLTFPPGVDLDSGGVVRRRCTTTDSAGSFEARLEDEAGAIFSAPSLVIRHASHYCGVDATWFGPQPRSCTVPQLLAERHDSRACVLRPCSQPCDDTRVPDCICEADPLTACVPSESDQAVYEACRNDF